MTILRFMSVAGWIALATSCGGKSAAHAGGENGATAKVADSAETPDRRDGPAASGEKRRKAQTMEGGEARAAAPAGTQGPQAASPSPASSTEEAPRPYFPTAAVFFNNDSAVLSVDRNGTLREWDLSGGGVPGRRDIDLGYGDKGWSTGPLVPVSSQRVLAVANGSTYCLDWAKSQRRIYDVNLPTYHPWTAVSPDEKLLLSGGGNPEDSSWRIFALPGDCKAAVGLRTPAILLDIDRYKKGMSTKAVFDRENRYLAFGTSHGYLFIWQRDALKFPNPADFTGYVAPYRDADAPFAMLGPTPKGVSSLAFGPGEMLAAGYFDGQVIVWDAAQQKIRRRFQMRESYPLLTAVDPGGHWVAAGGFDGSVWVWNATTGEAEVKPAAHAYRVTGLDFSKDGRLLLSAAIDGTFAVWRMPSAVEPAMRLQRAFGDKVSVPMPSPAEKDPCAIAAYETYKALFFLDDAERSTVSRGLIGEWVEDTAELSERLGCVKNENGSAWGLIPHEVSSRDAFDDAFKVWLLYVDKAGRKHLGGRHKGWSGGNHGLSLSARTYFDFNGDGVKEVIWTSEYWDKEDYSTDGSGATLNIQTFKNGKVSRYVRKKRGQYLSDVNKDGVPDLVVGPFHSVTMTSCGHSSEASHPVGPPVAAFATKSGGFFTTGKEARDYYRKQCPPNGSLSDGVLSGETVDNERLRMNIACAVLWGHRPAEIRKEIKTLCKNRHIESNCMDNVWFEPKQKGCIGVSHLLDIASATPPLILK